MCPHGSGAAASRKLCLRCGVRWSRGWQGKRRGSARPALLRRPMPRFAAQCHAAALRRCDARTARASALRRTALRSAATCRAADALWLSCFNGNQKIKARRNSPLKFEILQGKRTAPRARSARGAGEKDNTLGWGQGFPWAPGPPWPPWLTLPHPELPWPTLRPSRPATPWHCALMRCALIRHHTPRSVRSAMPGCAMLCCDV